MPRRNIPLSNLFVELSEVEQSVISGGFTPGDKKVYLSHTEDKIVDNYGTVTAYNSTELSVIENFSIDNSLNNLLGSSTFSLSADSIASSSILISGESLLTEGSSDSEIFTALPSKSQDEVSQLLDNNNINNFALSITHYSANVRGTETFNISGSAGNIVTSSNWTLNVDTAAVTGIFFPEKSSTLDVSSLIPGQNQTAGTNVSNFGLSFTYYSADFQQTEVSRISGLAGSAIASSTQFVTIDTESLSGMFLSQQVSLPFMLSDREKEGITNINYQNISNEFVINQSFGSSDNLWLSLNTFSGIAGSQAGLSASWERINHGDSDTSDFGNLNQLNIDSLLDNNFGASFGFSTSNYNSDIYTLNFSNLSGNVGSTEELINSILGITPNDNENINYFSSSGSYTNIPLNSGLDSLFTDVNNLSSSGLFLDNISSENIPLEDISDVRVFYRNNSLLASVNSGDENNNFYRLLGGANLTSQLRTIEKSPIELDILDINGFEINKPEILQGFTSDSPINNFIEEDNFLQLGNAGIGDYAFLSSNVFNFNTTNSNINSIDENSNSSFYNTFKSRSMPTNISGQAPTISNNLMPSMFLLFAANNSGNSILGLDKYSITKMASFYSKHNLYSGNTIFRNK